MILTGVPSWVGGWWTIHGRGSGSRLVWKTESSARDFSSAETCCWVGEDWPWVSRVCTVNLATCLVAADMRPGPSTLATQSQLFLQSSSRLVRGGTATNMSADSFGLNSTSWYFLATSWTQLVICCFMEINSSSLAFSYVSSTNPTRLSRVARASWRSSSCLSRVPTFFPSTSRTCCSRTCLWSSRMAFSWSKDCRSNVCPLVGDVFLGVLHPCHCRGDGSMGVSDWQQASQSLESSRNTVVTSFTKSYLWIGLGGNETIVMHSTTYQPRSHRLYSKTVTVIDDIVITALWYF